MDISGKWSYIEDFDFGTSEGEVHLTQNGNLVSGIFTFTEEVKNDYRIDVEESVTGRIDNGKLLLESIAVKAMQDGEEITYLPNTFEVHLVSESKLVGSTFDSEEVCGVFVLKRID